MKIISHRANLSGPNTAKFGENNPDSIDYVLSLGFDVEIDVSYVYNQLYLGHHSLEYPIDIDFLKNKNLWIHCKNIDGLSLMLDNDLHCFFHDTDECVLTSQKYIWTFPSKYIPLTSKSVAVKPEKVPDWDLSNVYAICTDFVERYK